MANFFTPSAAELAKKFLASLPSMTTEDAELKAKIDSAHFTLMNDEKTWLSLEDLPHEEWLPVIGYKGHYDVSNYGRVKSFQKNKTKILKRTKNKHGYFVVTLNNEMKQKLCTVHRLVALTFIPNPEDKTMVNHRDGCKLDNRLANLE